MVLGKLLHLEMDILSDALLNEMDFWRRLRFSFVFRKTKTRNLFFLIYSLSKL